VHLLARSARKKRAAPALVARSRARALYERGGQSNDVDGAPVPTATKTDDAAPDVEPTQKKQTAEKKLFGTEFT
jgi:hypothetical protein